MTALVYLTYFLENKNDVARISTGSFFLVVNYLEKISELFYQFTGLYGWTVRRKFRLLNGEQLSKDFRHTSFANHLLPKNWKQLQIENLTFSYGADNNSKQLDDVSFILQRGEKIAVVGETGSGKSTLLSVIRDLYHPQGGKLFVDGVLIPTGFEGISRAISLVQQDPEIFERSIRENITLGAEYCDDQIERYSEVACFDNVVMSLPKSYDSLIKEKGVNLSGGQVQRLALTRGLLASDDKDIVLLDEPTSSLDPATAMSVFSNILNQFRKKTVLSSVHTLQILPMFDRVFMFSKGKIVGMGTVAELLVSCPEFAEMWRKQFDATV
jgi:ABC-type multidrug transport system fused ATPase/permease subunit